MSGLTFELSTEEIQAKIAELSSIPEADLPNAMRDLKAALMENPAACSLLLPEDVGLMVKALRRITGVALVEASTKKPRTKKPAAIDMKSLEEGWDEL